MQGSIGNRGLQLQNPDPNPEARLVCLSSPESQVPPFFHFSSFRVHRSSLPLEPPGAARQRHVQQITHDVIGNESESDGNQRHRQQTPTLEYAQEKNEERNHG